MPERFPHGKRSACALPVAIAAATWRPSPQPFDAGMADFGIAVKAMDDYAAEHPGAFSAFGSFPNSMLGRLRGVQSRLQRSRGDLRRAAGMDMTFILSDYNTMVTTAQTATMFAK